MNEKLKPVASHPLGATPGKGGANFSLFSRAATRVELLFFNRADEARPSRVVELDPAAHRTYHYWHAMRRATSCLILQCFGTLSPTRCWRARS